MAERATANLPARDMDETAAFYLSLGFTISFKDEGWMILNRGSLEMEFFAHRDLNTKTSWFSACLRVDDLDALYADFGKAGLGKQGHPCLGDIRLEPPGLRLFALVDPNGSLLRCIDNRSTSAKKLG